MMKAQSSLMAQESDSLSVSGGALSAPSHLSPLLAEAIEPPRGHDGADAAGTFAPGMSRPAGVKEVVPFGPDVILPEQFYDSQRGMEYVSGERALMLAVLEDGIRCFQEHLRNPRVRPRLLARQAERWIRSDDWEWPFSFNNVCESLALNPDCLRAELLTPTKQELEGPRKPRPSSHRVYRLTPRVKPPRRR